jgi:hypothetical protein
MTEKSIQNSEEREHFEDIGVDVRIIVRRIPCMLLLFLRQLFFVEIHMKYFAISSEVRLVTQPCEIIAYEYNEPQYQQNGSLSAGRPGFDP